MARSLAIAVFAISLALTTPGYAISFTGTFTVTSAAATDPSLVIATQPGLGHVSDAFSFELPTLGSSWTIASLFTIGTPEGSVGFPFTDPDDSKAKDISVKFSFSQPSPGFEDTIEGSTRGVWLIQTGLLHWDGPLIVNFGNGGKLFIDLSDTLFHMAGNRGPDFQPVKALFKLTAAPSPVPVPAALPLFAGGIAMLGWLARRKRKQASRLGR